MDDNPGHKVQRANSALTIMGYWASGLYVAGLLAFIATGAYFGWVDLQEIKLNEIGDFLAGVCGPLAFFWLVLGFLQQGSELRLQVAELAESVRQQKELVDVTREALNHEREAALRGQEAERLKNKPDLRVRLMSKSRGAPNRKLPDGTIEKHHTYRLELLNAGRQLSDVYLAFDVSPLAFRDSHIGLLEPAAHKYLDIAFVEFGDAIAERLEMRCRSADGINYKLTFGVELNSYLVPTEEAMVA